MTELNTVGHTPPVTDLAPLLVALKRRAEGVPAPCRDPLAAVRTDVASSPCTLRARVLVRIVRSLAGHAELREPELAALKAQDSALAAALIDARIAGVYSSAE